MRFDKLAERQILKAQSEGQLDDLNGAGKPLNAEASCDAAQSAGFRIMAEAGVLPREFELKREAADLRAKLAETTDEAVHKAFMAKLAEVEMRRAIEEEARRKFMRP
ncbi:DnaJ family domain-containing protein [Celeribacter litoreus]|uniref:DnaJ family domain-containing protein n=1 Tax=Celeribacter litoreus TaxID=2876714 RepID=UPI001CCB08C0|nr:DUF1992 domain-containing protein [Celeribacter litoreus]MCA0044199.1 DUF1992 domain-containing protein [Celeribacter litoreus]